MEPIKIKQHPDIKPKFEAYPEGVQSKLTALRQLILEVAVEQHEIKEIEETLKWGEPSYLVKKGSTIRIDWKAKAPDQYAMYFKCTSKLVPTFKAVYGDLFSYEKDRAILFEMEEEIPREELKECIRLALCYHKLKHLPLMGKGSREVRV